MDFSKRVRSLSNQRYKKRFCKIFFICTIIISSLIALHRVGVAYSDQYSELSSNVGSLISEYLVDENSYMYDMLKFEGSLPKESMTEREILDWNEDLYQQEMKKPIDTLDHLPIIDEHYKRRDDATILVQVRNKDLKDLVSTIKQLELVFNDKFKYPYVFLNINEKYSGNFQKTIKDLLPNRELFFEHIPKEDIDRPRSVDREREQAGVEKLKKEGLIPTIPIGLLKSIFRYMSYRVYEHPRLKQFKWYWRIEPGTNFFNDVNYDVFQYMENNDKTFGFTIATYEFDPLTVENLLPTTMKFLTQDDNMNYLHSNNSHGFTMENLINPERSLLAKGYSTCHFWSSFEIGNMDFFRGDAYKAYFEFLDESNGFFYDRWGDGPVHSLGLSLLEDKSKIHWFKDIGYEQYPFFNCPESRTKNCETAKFSDDEFLNLNCLPMWLQYS